MFERFTDRARRVASLAGDIAHDMNHNEIGTEHLLAALAAEGEGVAARALKSLGIGEEDIVKAVLRRHSPGTVRRDGHIPYDRHAKKALELGLREALQLGHNYIGTEHLLLAQTRPGELGLGPQVLADCGIADGDLGFLDDVRRTVMELLRGYTDADATLRQSRAAVGHARSRLVGEALSYASRIYMNGAPRADDALFITARDLVAAVQQLPASEQPDGWGS